MTKSKLIFTGFCAVFLLAFFNISLYSQNFHQGQLILNFKSESLPLNIVIRNDSLITDLRSIDSLNSLFKCYALEKIYKGKWRAAQGLYLLRFPDTLDVYLVASAYSEDTHIFLVSPNHIGHLDVVPNDPHYYKQWGLPKIKSESAWNLEKGDSSVIILIHDSCLDWYHPDLGDSVFPNIWQNLGEDADGDGHVLEWDPVDSNWVFDPGDTNHYDDDQNGYPDDLVGWDRGVPPDGADNHPECLTSSGPPYTDHGDQVGGTAGAVTNNSEGVAGACWYPKLMAWRGAQDVDYCIGGIAYGRDNGAKIINMSWHFDSPNSNLEYIINSAYAEGVLLVASAGNEFSEKLVYPGSYENVIGVAATDINDWKEDYSNYGTWVDLCAPGYTYAPGRVGREFGYKDAEGTSFSSPFVGGVAALVWSACPNFTNAQVRSVIEATADPNVYPTYLRPKLGHGRVDAWNALVTINSGDVQNDKYINDGDVIYLINYLFKQGPPPAPGKGDCNGDGNVTLSDIVYLTAYLYQGGSPPAFCCSECFP